MNIEPAAFHTLLRQRRSRRFFTSQEIEPDKLERALQAAMRAPSGANTQPWEYVLIERGPIRDKVRELCEKADVKFHDVSPGWLKQFFKDHEITPIKEFAANAPYLVAVFGRRDLPFWLQSVWLSVANFITALELEGIHSLTYTPSLTRDFNKLLGVDETWSCQAVLPIGYGKADEELKPRPRLGPAEKAHVVDGEGKLKPFDARLPFEP
ncbi:MAG: nitroreductase family protein [Planctomycetes bacterium]|nr:nitroreductase family protein [Planctomycetota bacterium]MCA8947414.1 nitroreductase family protein [Planctomycetota bacterium]